MLLKKKDEISGRKQNVEISRLEELNKKIEKFISDEQLREIMKGISNFRNLKNEQEKTLDILKRDLESYLAEQEAKR